MSRCIDELQVMFSWLYAFDVFDITNFHRQNVKDLRT